MLIQKQRHRKGKAANSVKNWKRNENHFETNRQRVRRTRMFMRHVMRSKEYLPLCVCVFLCMFRGYIDWNMKAMMCVCVQECCGSMCLMHDKMAFAVTLFYGYFTIIFLFLSLSLFICFHTFHSFTLFLVFNSLLCWYCQSHFRWDGKHTANMKPETVIFSSSHQNVDFVPLWFLFFFKFYVPFAIFVYFLASNARKNVSFHSTAPVNVACSYCLVILADIISMSPNKNKSILLKHEPTKCTTYDKIENPQWRLCQFGFFFFFLLFYSLVCFHWRENTFIPTVCIETSIFAISALNKNAHSHARIHTRQKEKQTIYRICWLLFSNITNNTSFYGHK